VQQTPFSARHAKHQANEKIIAERVEKLAQRRVEERSEKMKNARKNRFDLRLNPLFSRPPPSRPKETAPGQEESPPEPDLAQDAVGVRSSQLQNLARSSDNLSPYTMFNTNRTESNKLVKRPRKMRYASHVDDNESGSTPTTVIETFSSLSLKRSSITSGSLVSTVARTDATSAITSIEALKVIFSSEHQKEYEHLFVVDRIANIFIQVVVLMGSKTMTGGQFRSFAR
jgi:hypothetical protein